MPLKQGTETEKCPAVTLLPLNKKDAPKAGDGNLKVELLSKKNINKKDAPKAGDGNILPALVFVILIPNIKKMPLKQGTET